MDFIKRTFDLHGCTSVLPAPLQSRIFFTAASGRGLSKGMYARYLLRPDTLYPVRASPGVGNSWLVKSVVNLNDCVKPFLRGR